MPEKVTVTVIKRTTLGNKTFNGGVQVVDLEVAKSLQALGALADTATISSPAPIEKPSPVEVAPHINFKSGAWPSNQRPAWLDEHKAAVKAAGGPNMPTPTPEKAVIRKVNNKGGEV